MWTRMGSNTCRRCVARLRKCQEQRASSTPRTHIGVVHIGGCRKELLLLKGARAAKLLPLVADDARGVPRKAPRVLVPLPVRALQRWQCSSCKMPYDA